MTCAIQWRFDTYTLHAMTSSTHNREPPFVRYRASCDVLMSRPCAPAPTATPQGARPEQQQHNRLFEVQLEEEEATGAKLEEARRICWPL